MEVLGTNIGPVGCLDGISLAKGPFSCMFPSSSTFIFAQNYLYNKTIFSKLCANVLHVMLEDLPLHLYHINA